jgi:hypothetical protein
MPAMPATARACTCGRPISTADAPRASALAMSVPRRTPPSSSRGTLPSYRMRNGRKGVERGRHAVQHSATMVGGKEEVVAGHKRAQVSCGALMPCDGERHRKMWRCQPVDG